MLPTCTNLKLYLELDWVSDNKLTCVKQTLAYLNGLYQTGLPQWTLPDWPTSIDSTRLAYLNGLYQTGLPQWTLRRRNLQ